MDSSPALNPKPRVALFVGCFAQQFRPELAMEAVQILERFGCTVHAPAAQTCCGRPFYRMGMPDQARELAKNFIELFEQYDYVVTPSAECGAMVRQGYGQLLGVNSAWEQGARKVASRTYELTQFLRDVLHVELAAPPPQAPPVAPGGEDLPNTEAIRALAERTRQHTLEHLNWYLAQARWAIERNGGTVHFAASESEARRIAETFSPRDPTAASAAVFDAAAIVAETGHVMLRRDPTAASVQTPVVAIAGIEAVVPRAIDLAVMLKAHAGPAANAREEPLLLQPPAVHLVLVDGGRSPLLTGPFREQCLKGSHASAVTEPAEASGSGGNWRWKLWAWAYRRPWTYRLAQRIQSRRLRRRLGKGTVPTVGRGLPCGACPEWSANPIPPAPKPFRQLWRERRPAAAPVPGSHDAWQDLLQRLRQTSGGTALLPSVTPVPPTVEEPVIRRVYSDLGLPELFVSQAKRQGAAAELVYVGELHTRLIELLRHRGCRRIGLRASRLLDRLQVFAALPDGGFDVQVEQEAGDLDCTIMGAGCAVAETGDLVWRDSGNAQIVPPPAAPFHVVILEPKDFVADLVDLMEKLASDGGSCCIARAAPAGARHILVLQ